MSMSAIKLENECCQERELRALMVQANYAGRWQDVQSLMVKLNQHHKGCPFCNGTALEQLFGCKVVVAAGS